MKIHMPGNWGITLCGKEGWNNHHWSSWETEDSLPNTMNPKKVTCKSCKRVLKAWKNPWLKL